MATHRSTIKKQKSHRFYFHPVNVNARRQTNRAGNIKFQLFRTPKYLLDDLYARSPELFKGRMLDPCGGDGRYLQFAQNKGNKKKHFIVDINKSELPTWHNNGLLKSLGQNSCYVSDFLTLDMTNKGSFDNVITNPPFKEARQIVDKCLELVKDGGHVTVLHRIDWVGTQERSKWMERRGLKSLTIICKRPVWEIDGKTKNVSDTREYAWFVFKKGYSYPPVVKWLTGGI